MAFKSFEMFDGKNTILLPPAMSTFYEVELFNYGDNIFAFGSHKSAKFSTITQKWTKCESGPFLLNYLFKETFYCFEPTSTQYAIYDIQNDQWKFKLK